jgi:kynurenine formamidase
MMTKYNDLSQLFTAGAPMWPRLAKDVQFTANSFVGIRSTAWGNINHPGWPDMGSGFPFNQGYCPMVAGWKWWGHLHAGTHVDAPIYAIRNGLSADKIPLENFHGTGVIVDMRNKNKWDTITAEDFEKATPKIKEGDFVVVNTGWHHQYKPIGMGDRAYEYFHYYPGLLPSAAEWLIKKKVKAIAGTWPVCDHSLSFAHKKFMPWLVNDYKRETGKEPKEGIKDLGKWEECLVMLLKAGVTCIQNAGGDIDDVTGKRMELCAWPFNLEHTDGAMVRLVGIEE